MVFAYLKNFFQCVYFIPNFLKKYLQTISYTTLIIVPNGICKIECLQKKIYLINVQIYHSTFFLKPSMCASMGTRFKLSLMNSYTSVLFYFRLCCNFNKLWKVSLVRFRKVNARSLSSIGNRAPSPLLRNSGIYWPNIYLAKLYWPNIQLFILWISAASSLSFHISITLSPQMPDLCAKSISLFLFMSSLFICSIHITLMN